MQDNMYPDMIILGSTGSVGEQAIDVAMGLGVHVNAISANKNVKRAEEQARALGVKACAMSDSEAADDLRIRLADTDIKVYSGIDGICSMISETSPEGESGQIVENSIVGEAGLLPTVATLRANKRLALANKESLVVGGEIVMELARGTGNEILPVDSEHCAIFQCLRAGEKQEIKRLILTASGGPFYGFSSEQLKDITVERALAHPTWKMGAKITVDSSTLMNKGFEVIEAVHLFGVSPKKVHVIVHRESIIHSAVEYIDNSIIAQMSVPDMRHCVQYALTHPMRMEGRTEELDLLSVGSLSFAAPDTAAFPLLSLAFDAIELGGGVPAALNAANEVAVDAFLSRKIGYTDIYETVAYTVQRMSQAASLHSLEDMLSVSAEARRIAADKIKN